MFLVCLGEQIGANVYLLHPESIYNHQTHPEQFLASSLKPPSAHISVTAVVRETPAVTDCHCGQKAENCPQKFVRPPLRPSPPPFGGRG